MRIAVFVADGCEEIEALTPVDILRRAGIETDLVSNTEELIVTGSHGIRFEAGYAAGAFFPENYDGILLPGGMPGTTRLSESALVRETAVRFAEEGKLVAAICAAPAVLASCGILKGRRACCYPSREKELLAAGAEVVHIADAEEEYLPVVRDGNIITSRGMGTAVDLGLAVAEYCISTEKAMELAASIVYMH